MHGSKSGQPVEKAPNGRCQWSGRAFPGGVVLLIFHTVNLSGDGINQPVKNWNEREQLDANIKSGLAQGATYVAALVCRLSKLIKITDRGRSRLRAVGATQWADPIQQNILDCFVGLLICVD